MMQFYALIVGLLLVSVVASSLKPLETASGESFARIMSGRLSVFAEAISEQYADNPAGGLLTPAVISATPGYEYLNSYRPSLFQSASAAGINDTAWRFQRLGMWFQLPYGYVEEADYLLAANNECGVGDFNVSTSWCGRPESFWLKLESRNSNSMMLLSEKQRLFRTMSKFYRRYSFDRKFSSVAYGGYATLASLAGYVGTASACAGVRVYEGIPLTCDDMFNAWGIPITLNSISKNRMALVNRTGVITSNGQPVRLAEEAVLE